MEAMYPYGPPMPIILRTGRFHLEDQPRVAVGLGSPLASFVAPISGYVVQYMLAPAVAATITPYDFALQVNGNTQAGTGLTIPVLSLSAVYKTSLLVPVSAGDTVRIIPTGVGLSLFVMGQIVLVEAQGMMV